jgi:hypothetical protein
MLAHKSWRQPFRTLVLVQRSNENVWLPVSQDNMEITDQWKRRVQTTIPENGSSIQHQYQQRNVTEV